MLIETHIRPMLAKPEYAATATFRRQYQSAVGFFMYVILGTRLDIAFAVSIISRYFANPIEAYMQFVKRVFRYLQGIIFMGLVFRKELGELTGYIDSDFARDYNTRRSTSG